MTKQEYDKLVADGKYAEALNALNTNSVEGLSSTGVTYARAQLFALAASRGVELRGLEEQTRRATTVAPGKVPPAPVDPNAPKPQPPTPPRPYTYVAPIDATKPADWMRWKKETEEANAKIAQWEKENPSAKTPEPAPSFQPYANIAPVDPTKPGDQLRWQKEINEANAKAEQWKKDHPTVDVNGNVSTPNATPNTTAADAIAADSTDNAYLVTAPDGTTKEAKLLLPEGYPANYTPMVYENGGVVRGTANYYEGNEFSAWGSASEAERIAWKKQLKAAGYYPDNTDPVYNANVTQDDILAMRTAMINANLSGTEWIKVTSEQIAANNNPNSAANRAEAAKWDAAFEAASNELRNWAYNNGISLTEDYIGRKAKAIANGETTVDETSSVLRDTHVVKSYPGFAEQIKAGQDVRDLAAPYISSYATILELPESEIKLTDPIIKKALQGVDKNGNPTYVPLWAFEEEVRKDPRWQYTDNARSVMMDYTDTILRTFGMIG